MGKWKHILKSKAADSPLIWAGLKQMQAAQYEVGYQRFYGPLSATVASTTEINLEFCSGCNLRCSFCALDHSRPNTYMSLEVLDRVFDTLLNDDRFRRVKTINLHNGGETLLHPRRLDLFARIKYYQILFRSCGRPFPKIILLTNGMLLREKLAREILKLQVLDEIGFSLDGGTPEEFEKLRVNAKWDKFTANLHAFFRLKEELQPALKTFGITIVPKPLALNNSWMHPDFRAITEQLDSVEYRRLHDWGGQVDIGESSPVNKKGCTMLLRQLIVLPTGEVSVCCNDLNRQGVVGNILEEELYAIYKGKERMRYVDLLKQGRKQELELCKDCVSF